MSETSKANSGTLVALAAVAVTLVGGIFGSWSALDKRVSVNEANIKNQDQRTTELQTRIDDRLRQMDRKLDVIVERQLEK